MASRELQLVFLTFTTFDLLNMAISRFMEAVISIFGPRCFPEKPFFFASFIIRSLFGTVNRNVNCFLPTPAETRTNKTATSRMTHRLSHVFIYMIITLTRSNKLQINHVLMMIIIKC